MVPTSPMPPRNSKRKCLKSALNRAYFAASLLIFSSFFFFLVQKWVLFRTHFKHLQSEFFEMQTLCGTLWARPTWIKRKIRNVRAKTTSKRQNRRFWESKSLISAYFESIFSCGNQTAFSRVKFVLDLPFISAPKSASLSQGLLESSMKIRHMRAKTAKTVRFHWIFIENSRKRLFLLNFCAHST